jgi:hypothetical protein
MDGKTCADCKRNKCGLGRFLCNDCWDLYQFVKELEARHFAKEDDDDTTRKAS